jgi:CheY-like chemotaxis protein
MALVRVRDSGIGIDPPVLGRLFEPFTQADSSLDRSKGGLGLGLALVKGLAELHGGSVEARSDGLGKGAEFTLRLPLHRQPAASAAEGSDLPSGAPGRRVLIIEDNVDAAETLREVLRLENHTVEVAYDGVNGIAKAREFRPDVVLCDIGLPGMDGYGVARSMRADPTLRSVWLVALTGYAGPDDLAQARAAGFADFLVKPPSPKKLEQALARLQESARRD